MTSVFKDFRNQFLLRQRLTRVPDIRYLLTGCIFFIAGCCLGAICLSYGASWIFALLYIFLGSFGSIICYYREVRIFPILDTEILPLIPSTSKTFERTKPTEKISSKNCNPASLDINEIGEANVDRGSMDIEANGINVQHDKIVRKSLISLTNAEKSETATIQLPNKAGEVGKRGHRPRDSFYELGVSSPNTKLGEQQFIPLDCRKPYVNICKLSEGMHEQTSNCGTSTRLKNTVPPQFQRKAERETILLEKPFDGINISPLHFRSETENSLQSDKRGSIPVDCINTQPLRDHKKQHIGAKSVGQDTNCLKAGKWAETSHQRTEMTPGKDLHTMESNIKPQSGYSDLLCCGRLTLNNRSIHELGLKTSNFYDAIGDKSSPKSEKSLEVTTSDTSILNIDKSTIAIRRLLALSAKTQFRIPERHSNRSVSRMQSEHQEYMPKEEFKYQANEFSNRPYCKISRLVGKHCDVADVHASQGNKAGNLRFEGSDKKPVNSLRFDSQFTDSSEEGNEIGVYSSITEVDVAHVVQSKQTLILDDSFDGDIHFTPQVSLVESNFPEMRHLSSLELPMYDLPELEEFSNNTTDSFEEESKIIVNE